MKNSFTLSLYRGLLALLSPVILGWLLRESWQHKRIALFCARLGKTQPIEADHWLHCASVGEVNAVAPLVQALHEQNNTLLITTFTPSGLAQAEDRFAQCAHVQIRLLPFDWQWTVKRFLTSVNCSKLTLVETEFWPNLIALAAQQGRQLNLINARVTPKTLQAPAWWRRLLASQLNQHFQQILCRNAYDAQDFNQLGIVAQKIKVVGNLKWCHQPPRALSRLTPLPYVLFASTHATEEIELAKVWQEHPQLPQLVIVPRHPKRGKSISKQLTQAKIAFCQRSVSHEQQSGILLADTFGELTAWMAHAELVIMGGSFAPKGGQNPLEAVRLAKLVLSGPDMRDFADEVEQLVELGALIQVPLIADLIPLIVRYLAQPEAFQASAQAGQDWLLNRQKGILDQIIHALESNHAVS